MYNSVAAFIGIASVFAWTVTSYEFPDLQSRIFISLLVFVCCIQAIAISLRPNSVTPFTSEDGSTHNNNVNKYERRIAQWTVVVGSFTALLSTDRAIHGELIEMQNQSAVTHNQLKANFGLTIANYTINGTDGKTLAWIFTPVWKNSGGTEALRAHGWVDIQFFARDASDIFDFLLPRFDIPNPPFFTSVPQGNEFMHPTRSLSGEEMKSIADGKGKGIIWGHLEYNDVFPNTKTHHVHYCLNIFPANVGNLTSFPLYRPECNFSD